MSGTSGKLSSHSPSDKTDIFGGDVCRPLHLGCVYGGVEVDKYLLTFSSVLLSVDEWDGSVFVAGWGALDWACGHEHLSVLELLLNEPSVLVLNYLPSHKFAFFTF